MRKDVSDLVVAHPFAGIQRDVDTPGCCVCLVQETPWEVHDGKRWVPFLWGSQQTHRKKIISVEISEQGGVLGTWEHATNHGVDHTVKDKVVRSTFARNSLGVAQQHMVDLVEDEHHEFLWGVGVLGHKLGVHQKSWGFDTLNSR